jgi:hypothetical protein
MKPPCLLGTFGVRDPLKIFSLKVSWRRADGQNIILLTAFVKLEPKIRPSGPNRSGRHRAIGAIFAGPVDRNGMLSHK